MGYRHIDSGEHTSTDYGEVRLFLGTRRNIIQEYVLYQPIFETRLLNTDDANSPQISPSIINVVIVIHFFTINCLSNIAN